MMASSRSLDYTGNSKLRRVLEHESNVSASGILGGYDKLNSRFRCIMAPWIWTVVEQAKIMRK